MTTTQRSPSRGSWTDEFLDNGIVVVEDALDSDFCEHVIADALERMGLHEDEPQTWPKGWHNLPATKAYPLEEVAPLAAEALFELVGPPASLKFYGIPDNLIINFPDPEAAWWPPEAKSSHLKGWHKDGDWFRHFLDSPEQGMLGIIFWRDVTERQGPTYVLSDSIPTVAQILANHPEGLNPPIPLREVVRQSERPIAMTGRQGTIVWAHPFLVHCSSVNATDQLRIISNTSVMMKDPLRFDRETLTPLERSVLNALGVTQLDWKPTGDRGHVVSERERKWRKDDQDEPRSSATED